jgi:VanZ family protein
VLVGMTISFIRIIFWSSCFVFGFLCIIPTVYLPSGLFDWWDKAQHIFAFFYLSGLGILGYSKSVSKVSLGLLMYGGLIEIIQWITGWRSGDWADWLADGIGILLSVIILNIFILNRLKLFKSKY